MEVERRNRALAVVMPWLPRKEMGCLGLTCRALAAASASLSSVRASDIARGLERFAVPAHNAVDLALHPFFCYSPFSILGAPPPALPWGLPSHTQEGKPPYLQPLAGGRLDPDVCSCVASHSCLQTSESSLSTHGFLEAESLPPAKKQRQAISLCGRALEGDLAYDSDSRLRCLTMFRDGDDCVPPCDFLSIVECGPACDCSSSCEFRVTQHGLAAKVAVYKDQHKGWSLQSMQPIEKGTFVFEYAGELLTTAEAQKRQRQYDKLRKMQKGFSSSLLVLREHLPSGNLCLRLNIDATHVGNVARFVNHACDGGNLQPCIVRMSGCPIPKLVFFARFDIAEGEELTFSYGDEHESKAYQCFCKTASCKGYLPFEET